MGLNYRHTSKLKQGGLSQEEIPSVLVHEVNGKRQDLKYAPSEYKDGAEAISRRYGEYERIL
jgi:hypothetical protein